MTNDTPTVEPESADSSTPRSKSDDCDPKTNPDDCDPKKIGKMTCRAKGIKAQADYDDKVTTDLVAAQENYDKTRKAYRDARHQVTAQVQDLTHQARHLVQRTRCLIKQKRVWECIDDAFCEIVHELKCCERDEGCCAFDCTYDSTCDEKTSIRKLQRRIARYQARADKAKECFTRLLGEPDNLQKRVDEAKKRIDALNVKLAGDPATLDPKWAYAEALVIRRLLKQVWGGFARTTDFVDCLCRALTCWTEGCAAVSILTGCQAVKQCEDEATKARCEKLKTDTVVEILLAYDKCCPEQDECKDPHDDDKDDDCDNHDDDDDGGGGHHHHHHHKHDDDCGCKHDEDGDERDQQHDSESSEA